MRKLLAVFAHPDDEAFGPGGTLVRYASEGVEIHLLCATRGESGDWDAKLKIKNEKSKIKEGNRIEHIREKELLKSAEILGIKKVEFLNFIDGQLSNAIYHQLAEKIIKKITLFAPQVVLTFERMGVSGHLDHIAVSMITTYSFLKTRQALKLYYYCMYNKVRDKKLDSYFVYFPEGYGDSQITTRIDYSRFWKKKKLAMYQHQSQIKDVERIAKRISKFPKIDYFILQYSRSLKVKPQEDDLFDGLSKLL